MKSSTQQAHQISVEPLLKLGMIHVTGLPCPVQAIEEYSGFEDEGFYSVNSLGSLKRAVIYARLKDGRIFVGLILAYDEGNFEKITKALSNEYGLTHRTPITAEHAYFICYDEKGLRFGSETWKVKLRHIEKRRENPEWDPNSEL